MIDTAYDILRVDRNASPDDVRKAYVRLVRRYPPEHFPEKFAKLRSAYQQLTLSDDFVDEMFKRIVNSESPLEMAACLWGSRKELVCDRPFAPDDLMPLLAVEDARRELYGLLDSPAEIEWKTGGSV